MFGFVENFFRVSGSIALLLGPAGEVRPPNPSVQDECSPPGQYSWTKWDSREPKELVGDDPDFTLDRLGQQIFIFRHQYPDGPSTVIDAGELNQGTVELGTKLLNRREDPFTTRTVVVFQCPDGDSLLYYRWGAEPWDDGKRSSSYSPLHNSINPVQTD